MATQDVVARLQDEIKDALANDPDTGTVEVDIDDLKHVLNVLTNVAKVAQEDDTAGG